MIVMVALAAAAAPADQPVDPLAVAEVMVGQKRFAEARRILDVLAAGPAHDHARDNQVQFLLGILAIEDKDYDRAIAHFHRILVNDPKQVRVRLELGRAYFHKKDYADAQRQFQFARAGHLPPTVQSNVDRFLGAIRALQTLSYGLSFSLAADSNLNAGPATDTVSLYGLPFQLSPDARANEGAGLALDTNAEWSPRLTAKLKWRGGVQLHRSQFGKSEFDDMTLGVYTGPHLTLKRWDFNLLGTASRRWYGDRNYTKTYGGSFDATWFATARLGLGASAGWSQVIYSQNPTQSGAGHSYAVNAFYTPTPSSLVRGTFSLGSQGAQNPGYANRFELFSLSYSRELAGGLTVSLAPSYTRIDYAGALAGVSSVTRHDRQYSGQIALLDRKIDWGGFTPRVAYTYTRNDSSIALYTFHRNRLEFGVTRAF